MAEESRQTALVAWLLMLMMALMRRIQELEDKLCEDSTSSKQLIHAWEGILVSDDYGTYRK